MQPKDASFAFPGCSLATLRQQQDTLQLAGHLRERLTLER